MRRMLLLIVLLTLLTSPVIAQDTPPVPVCDGAQAWYTHATEPLPMFIGIRPLLSEHISPFELVERFEAMQTAIQVVEALTFPECVALPREFLLRGYSAFIEVVEMVGRGERNTIAFVEPLLVGAVHIGRAQGYMQALGIEAAIRD